MVCFSLFSLFWSEANFAVLHTLGTIVFFQAVGDDEEDEHAPFMRKPFCVYRGHTADLLDLSWSKVRSSRCSDSGKNQSLEALHTCTTFFGTAMWNHVCIVVIVQDPWPPVPKRGVSPIGEPGA